MKAFMEPELEIEEFSVKDVITVSDMSSETPDIDG